SDPAFLAEFPDSVFTPARTTLMIPLIREGAAIGSLEVGRDRARPFTDTQIALMETFADQAVIAIENARLFAALRDRVGELQALGEVGQAVSSSLDLQEVLTTIVAHATRLAGADAGTIYALDDRDRPFVPRAYYQMPEDLLESVRQDRLRLAADNLLGRAALRRAPEQE